MQFCFRTLLSVRCGALLFAKASAVPFDGNTAAWTIGSTIGTVNGVDVRASPSPSLSCVLATSAERHDRRM